MKNSAKILFIFMVAAMLTACTKSAAEVGEISGAAQSQTDMSEATSEILTDEEKMKTCFMSSRSVYVSDLEQGIYRYPLDGSKKKYYRFGEMPDDYVGRIFVTDSRNYVRFVSPYGNK